MAKWNLHINNLLNDFFIENNEGKSEYLYNWHNHEGLTFC